MYQLRAKPVRFGLKDKPVEAVQLPVRGVNFRFIRPRQVGAEPFGFQIGGIFDCLQQLQPFFSGKPRRPIPLSIFTWTISVWPVPCRMFS